ncbi:MAG: hypothetical protein AAFY06_10850 [Pseudomonadota bacterium]
MSLDEAEAALDQAVASFIEEGVDAEELERLKNQYRASQIYAQDSISGLANRYGAALTSGLTVADVQAWPEILQAVTEEDIIAAAKLVFNRENAVTGHVSTVEEVTQ